MRKFQRKTLRHALWLCVILLAGCGNPGHNDNPSQKIATGRVGCLAAAEFFSVYFSTHLKPSRATPGSSVARTQFRSYCGDLPEPGKVFFTADLIDPELRKTLIEILVVEQEPAGNGTGSAERFRIVRTLMDMPAQKFDKGTIQSSFEIEKTGQYAVYLIRKEQGSGRQVDKLMIPLNVGVDTRAGFIEKLLAPQIMLVVGLGIAGLTIFLKAYQFNPVKKS